MKTIKYLYLSGEGEGQAIVEKMISCESEESYVEAIAIAENEAINGEYTVEDHEQPKTDNASTDDVLNALLGVSE